MARRDGRKIPGDLSMALVSRWKPFAKGLRPSCARQYLASLSAPLTAATQAGRKEDAAIWTAERQAIAAGGNVPATDDPGTPNSLKSLRASYWEQFAKLDKQRFDRARALFAQCDAALVKNKTDLESRNLSNDAQEVQKERDQLRAAWLQPPVAATAAATAGTGAAGVPAKFTPQQVLEKLLSLNASVMVKAGKNAELLEIKSVSQVADQKFTFWHVELPAEKKDQTPLVAADYAILDSCR